MEKLLLELLESTTKNKKGLRMLKDTAVRCQNFELASKIREMENKFFPETKQEKEAKRISCILRMVELNVDDKTCYVISEALKYYSEKNGSFSIKDASEIIATSKEIFDI